MSLELKSSALGHRADVGDGDVRGEKSKAKESTMIEQRPKNGSIQSSGPTKFTICSYQERYLDRQHSSTNQIMTNQTCHNNKDIENSVDNSSRLAASNSAAFRNELARCLIGKLSGAFWRSGPVSGKAEVIAASERVSPKVLDASGPVTSKPNVAVSAMKANLRQIKSGVSKPLRQINVTGQLNHAANRGLLLVIACMVLACGLNIDLESVKPKMQFAEASAIWPFAKISPVNLTSHSNSARQRAPRQSPVNGPSPPQALAQPETKAPVSQQFHYFWNHDQIEPKVMAEEANAILNEAQAQTDKISAGAKSMLPAGANEGTKLGEPSTRQDSMVASGSEQRSSVGATNQPLMIPPAIQQQLTQMVLQLQRQQQMSVLSQPRFDAPDINSMALRRASHPSFAGLFAQPAAPFAPMSRYWASASSQHPVLTAPPMMMAGTEPIPNWVGFGQQQLRPPAAAATIAGVPVYGPFAVNPALPPLGNYAPTHVGQVKSRLPDQAATNPSQAAGSRLSLLSRRKSWPLFGIGSSSQLSAAASHIKPTIVQPPTRSPNAQAQQVGFQLTPESLALLDAASDQLASAIAGQLQWRGAQQKLALALARALNPAQGSDTLQTGASQVLAQHLQPSAGLQIGQKPVDLQNSETNPIPPYLLSNLLYPAQVGLSLAGSLFGPPTVPEQHQANQTAIPFGNRLRRRQLGSGQSTVKSPVAPYALDRQVESVDSTQIQVRKARQLRPDVLKQQANQRIVKKDLVRTGSAQQRAVSKLLDESLNIESQVRRLKRSISGASSGWRSLASSDEPAADLLMRRHADQQRNESSSIQEDAQTNRQERQIKIKRLTASASVLHHPVSHRHQTGWRDGERVRSGQVMAGTPLRLMHNTTSSSRSHGETSTASPDPMSGSISESARVNYFQNVEKDNPVSQNSNEISASNTANNNKITSGPSISQPVEASSGFKQLKLAQVPAVDVGFPPPIITSSSRTTSSGGSSSPNGTRAHGEDSKQQLGIAQTTLAGFNRPVSASSSNIVGQARPRLANQQSVIVSNADTSSHAGVGNYAHSNAGTSGGFIANQHISPLVAELPVLNKVKSSLKQLGSSASSLDIQQTLLNSLLNLGSAQSQTSNSVKPTLLSTASSKQQQATFLPPPSSQQSSIQTKTTSFDLANQGSSFGEPSSTNQNSQSQMGGTQDLVQGAERFQSLGSSSFNSLNQDQSEVNADGEGQFGLKNSVNSESSVGDNTNLELNRFPQQQSMQGSQQLSSPNDENRQDAVGHSDQSNQPAGDSLESNLFGADFNQQSGGELGSFNAQSVQPSINDPQQQPKLENSHQTLSPSQIFPSQRQLQALAGAAISNYNQRLSNLGESAIRSSQAFHHPRTSGQFYPHTIDQAIHQRHSLHPPPGGYYAVDEDAAALTNAAAGIASYPSSSQLMAFQHSHGHLNDLNAMLMAGSENREQGDEKPDNKQGGKKTKKKDFKQISHHYHFNNLASPFEDPENQFAPINPFDIATNHDLQQQQQQQRQKAKANKEEEKQEEEKEEEEKPKKKRFLRRFSIKRLFKKLKREKKKGNTSDDSKEVNEQGGE